MRVAGFFLLALSLLCTSGLVAAQESYEGGRGLITLEGPSGMFINPTSGTLPEGHGTVQYAIFLPDNNTDVVGHGISASYGITDYGEIGVTGNFIDVDNDFIDDEFTAAGPYARLRLSKDEGVVPEVSIGAYSHFGDDELESHAGFLAAYKRLPIDDNGFLRSVGVHGGAKHLWIDDDANPDDTSFAGYGGVELEIPCRIYIVGEVQTKDSDFHDDIPYSFGVQWRAAGISMSLAGIQNGSTDDPGFYYGIGGDF